MEEVRGGEARFGNGAPTPRPTQRGQGKTTNTASPTTTGPAGRWRGVHGAGASTCLMTSPRATWCARPVVGSRATIASTAQERHARAGDPGTSCATGARLHVRNRCYAMPRVPLRPISASTRRCSLSRRHERASPRTCADLSMWLCAAPWRAFVATPSNSSAVRNHCFPDQRGKKKTQARSQNTDRPPTKKKRIAQGCARKKRAGPWPRPGHTMGAKRWQCSGMRPIATSPALTPPPQSAIGFYFFFFFGKKGSPLNCCVPLVHAAFRVLSSSIAPKKRAVIRAMHFIFRGSSLAPIRVAAEWSPPPLFHSLAGRSLIPLDGQKEDQMARTCWWCVRGMQ